MILLSEQMYICYPGDGAMTVKEKMIMMNFDVFRVEQYGGLIGYVRIDELSSGIIGD